MSSSIDPYAELASLFLTDEGDAPPPIPIAGRGTASMEREIEDAPRPHDPLGDDVPVRRGVGAPIEIALVGHLPVMGGLWLTQYADQTARREGATALVRLERGQVTLELLRDAAHRTILDRVGTAEEAIAELAGCAKRWIVCPGSEAAVDGPLPGDALSLLTGGDDAATVAAYRIMKNLAERWHAAHWPVPPIGLVVFGAAPDRVDEVAEKLDRTTKAFLDVDLAVVGQQQRMDAIDSSCRRTFQGVELSVDDVVRRIRQPREARRRPEPARAAPAAVATIEVRDPLGATLSKLAPKPSLEAAGHASGRGLGRPVGQQPAQQIDRTPIAGASRHDGDLRSDAGSGAAFVEPSRSALDDVDARFDPAAGPTLTFVPSPLDEPAPTRHAPLADADRTDAATSCERRPGLAAHLPGLAALPLRPPQQPDVELARDDAGRLHLVVRDRHLASLRPGEAWARAHLDLLRVAFPDLSSHEGAVILDVVTDDPPTIIPLHGTGLRLHLVIEHGSGTLHVPLNR